MTETRIAETEVLTLQLHGAIRTCLTMVRLGRFELSGEVITQLANELEVLTKFAQSLEDGHLLVVTPLATDAIDELDFDADPS